MTYTAEGTWYFEGRFDGKIYCLEVFYPRNRYTLIIGNLEGGSPTETKGRVTDLLADINNLDPKPEYAFWMERAIAYTDWGASFESYDTLDKIFFGNKQCCWVKSNVRTGCVEISFPPMVLVSPRLLISENFPQIHSIKNGKLHELLIQFINTTQLSKNTEPKRIPDYNENELTEFEIDGLKIGMAYDEKTDVISLHLGGYTEVVNANTVFDDVWEISTIDDGRFKEEFRKTLARRGFAKIWETP